MIDLATQERLHAIERRLEEVEARFADSNAAVVDLQGMGLTDRRRRDVERRVLHGYEHQTLLVERERLEEESFKLWQSARRAAEAA